MPSPIRPVIRLILISIVLVLSVASFSSAQPGRGPHRADPHGPSHRPGPPPGRFIEQQAERLGLDEQTRHSIRQIVEESRTRGQHIRESLHQAQTAMHQLLEQDMPDAAAVLQQAEKIGNLHIEKQKNRLAAMLQIRALLTPEQRQTLAELRKEDHPPRRGRRGRGRRRFGSCRKDIATLCPDAEPGRASLQCMLDNWEALSEDCRSFFEQLQRRGRGRGGRRHGDFGPPVPLGEE